MEKSTGVTKRPQQARSYIGTLNNPNVEPETFLATAYQSSKFSYVGGQLEKGENGVPHI